MTENGYQIRGIPSEMVEGMWRYAEPYIKRALDHTSGELFPEDLKSACQNRTVQLWLIVQENRVVAAITTEIVQYPRRKHCRIITLSGSDAAAWTKPLDEVLMKWAKEQGCHALEAYVRKGYVPKLALLGFKHRYSAVHKMLDSPGEDHG